MIRSVLPFALCASLATLLSGCHIYYFAHATVPLSVPADTACLRSTLTDARPFSPLRGTRTPPERISVVTYSTPAMFHHQWDVVSQVAWKDSSVFRGLTHFDSSASLEAHYVQLDRPILRSQAPLTTGQMTRFLLELRDACGGRSPDDEPLFYTNVPETPYLAWVIRGTEGRVAMRLTVEDRSYRMHWVRDPGRHVLRLDTLASASPPRQARWLEIDSLEVRTPARDETLTNECWRGDSLATGNLFAMARRTDSRFLPDVRDAWEIDTHELRIRPTSTEGIECANSARRGSLPDAPRVLRSAALTFRPAPGMSRLYAYAPFPHGYDEITTVAVDSQVVGRVSSGAFLMVEVEPGRRRVSGYTSGPESVVWVDAAPDSSYFIDIRTDKWALSTQWRPRLGAADPERGREVVREAHMAPSSWPGMPMKRPE